jgi:hypothetical protein
LTQYPQKPTFELISPLKILLDKLLLKPLFSPPKISLDTPPQNPLKKSYEIFKKPLDLIKAL